MFNDIIKKSIIGFTLIIAITSQASSDELFASYKDSQKGVTIRDVNTLSQRTFHNNGHEAGGIALDSNNNYYLPSTNHLLKYDPNGSLLVDMTFPISSIEYTDVAVRGNKLYASYKGSQQGVTIRDTTTLTQISLFNTGINANGIAVNSNSDIYLAFDNHLRKYNTSGTILADMTFPDPAILYTSVAVRGDRVYATYTGSQLGFTIRDASTLNQVRACTTGFSAQGIAVDSSNNIYIATGNHLRKYDNNCTLLVDMTFPISTINYTGVAISENGFAINSNVPHDVTNSGQPYPKVSLTELSNFAWDEFIALNHPADPDHRGQPKPGSSLSDAADARVWESYWHRVEVFPGNQSPVNIAGKAKVTGKPSYVYPAANFQLNAANFDAKSSTGPMDATLWNNLDENNELNVDKMFAHVSQSGKTFTGFTDENRIVYEAKINEDAMNYILSSKLYNSKIRDSMTASTKSAANLKKYGSSCGNASSSIISSPCGAIGGAEGSIEIKAAWRKLDSQELNSGKYYTNKVIRYQSIINAKTKKPENKWIVDVYGMIALHIIHKTENFPSYVFATFEHVDNIASKIGYIDEITQTGRGTGDVAGAKVVISERDNPIPKEVAAVNSVARKAIDGTVFSNYQLIGVQAYPVDYSTISGTSSPTQSEKSTYYLANIVVESNEELQNFRGLKVADKPDHDNIVAMGKSMNMGGCMGCHGVAQVNGADFSFLIKNSPFTAPEIVGGTGVNKFIDIKSYADVQEMLSSFVNINGINVGRPHMKFWTNLSYDKFIKAEVPNVGVKILKCGDAKNSNLIKILKGTLTGFPRMPLGGPYFPDEQIESLEKWVEADCLPK